MNDEFSIGVPDNWKESIRDNMIVALVGDQQKQIEAYTKIGYAYQRYAPASIYKYYRPDSRALQMLKNNKLWFSAPNKFNDVFDVDLPIDREAVFKNLVAQFAGATGIRAGSPAWKNAHAEMLRQEKQFKTILDHIRQTTGIACFSESCESLLMWSHYAQNHQGICAEYELLSFNKELGFVPVPVVYSSKRVRLNSIDSNNTALSALNFFVKGLTSKAKEWSYENEWRIIRESEACGTAWDEEKQGALLPSIKPSSIILGCEASGGFERSIQQYCESYKVNLYKMEKDQAEYKLTKKSVLQFDT